MHNMVTLFIDESGKASLADKNEDPFVLTGVILKNSDLPAIEGYFNYIKRKFEIPISAPFHTFEVYEKPSSKLTDKKLLELSQSLAEYISLIPLQIILTRINKSIFAQTLGIKSEKDFKGDSKRKELKEYPYRVSAAYVFGHFAKFLEKEKSVGQIVTDSRRGGDHQLLKTLELCKEGAIPFNPGYADAIRNRISSICFADKKLLSGGLEITDLISYTSFMRSRRLLSQTEHIGLPILWEHIKKTSNISIGEINEKEVRSFFKLKPGEVHKYLKNN